MTTGSIESRIEALESQLNARDERIKELEARVQELEDVREINDVMRRWHYACTGGFNGIPAHRAREALDLLTDDATIELQMLHDKGTGPTGTEALFEYLRQFEGDDGKLPQVFQTGSDYRVEVHGDTAVQRSNIVTLAQGEVTGGRAQMGTSRYVNEFVRAPEGWKIKKISLVSALNAPFQEQVRSAQIRPGSGWTSGE